MVMGLIQAWTLGTYRPTDSNHGATFCFFGLVAIATMTKVEFLRPAGQAGPPSCRSDLQADEVFRVGSCLVSGC